MNANRPAKLAGGGLSGPQDTTARDRRRAQRAALVCLLADGVPLDEIREKMAEDHELTHEQTDLMLEEARSKLLEEHDHTEPIKRAAAEHRILRHIRAAAGRNQWGAVGQLEKTLATVQGTEQPKVSRLEIDARLQAATLSMLGALEPTEVQRLIAEELERLPKLPGAG